MKLLYNDVNDKIVMLRRYISQQVNGDYIYDYPPRQAYQPLKAGQAMDKIKQSLGMDDEINLYIHFPFCKQICSYCNLFAICDTDEQTFETYFKALEKEVLFYKPYIDHKKVNTVYLGGGTPSWISPAMFAGFFAFLEQQLHFSLKDVPEVAIELSPDTADPERLRGFIDAGINRVNIGVQAVNDGELCNIGRQYGDDMIKGAIKNVLSAGFDNVCVDLIYGIQSQTMESWEQSVKYVARCCPPTICPYPLTLRENTGFAYKGFKHVDGAEQYKKYEYARDYLLSHGYEQETHVRYKLKGSHGGYIQKENHWKQQNILGLGAGARSYLKTINCRNGYSVVNRRSAYNDYLRNIGKYSFAVTDGYEMTADEAMRKRLVLGLDGLNRADFEKNYGEPPEGFFPGEFKALYEMNLLCVHDDIIHYTTQGMKYRDLIVQLFFSDRVNDIISHFNYAQ